MGDFTDQKQSPLRGGKTNFLDFFLYRRNQEFLVMVAFKFFKDKNHSKVGGGRTARKICKHQF